MRALATEPCFDEYMFIEQDRRKVELLRSHCERYSHLPVDVRHGDCNEILLKTVFPRIRQDRRLRAVLLMDPYGLQYDWSVVVEAGATKRVDLILNFPMMGAQRAAFWRRPDDLPASLRRRMRRAWGDDSWLRTVYEEVPNLLAKDPDFGPELVKKPCREIAEVCRKRIREKATFKYVAAPHHSRNGHGTVIFFLFLASQIRVAEKVMDYIVKTKGKQSWRSQP